MAHRHPETIRLGDRTFDIKPLTIDQVERIEAAMTDTRPGIRQAREIVAIGMSRDHAQADLSGMEATVDELSDAMQTVLRQGGFVKTPLGEAGAAAENVPTGGASEGA